MRTVYGLVLSLVLAGFFFTNEARSQDIDHWETVVFDWNVWHYLVPVTEPDAAWRTLSFDDTGWLSGPGGFGYGDDDDRTIIGTARSVYQRITFSISDTSNIGFAVLHVDYDDAFVAYLNGIEIFRRNIGTPGLPPLFDQFADGNHEAVLYQSGIPEGVSLTKALLTSRLRQGENVLAVQTHNVDATSSDLTSRVFFSVGLTDGTAGYGVPPAWFAPAYMLSSNLPLIVIDTQGQAIPDEPKITARMGIIDNGTGAFNSVSDSYNDYDGFIGVELRGSSSQMFPKKSYGIETRDSDGEDLNVELLGFPEEEDWVLHGPYSDKSLMRNRLIFHMAAQTGRYASRTRFVELILNGDYRGVYVFMEKLKRDKNRVDINKLKSDEIEGDDLTGGYIFKIDKTAGSELGGWISPFIPGPGLGQPTFYQYHYPKGSDIVPEQEAYIQGYVAAFEEMMASDDFANADSGYSQYIDVDSAVDFFILNEIPRNVDAYRLSTFFYKDKDSIGDGKLVFGPIWDFNLGFGNADYYDGGNSVGFQVQESVPETDSFQPPFWWEKLWKDPTFNERVQQRWASLRQGPWRTDSLMQFIDATVVTLQDASERNFERWPVLNEYVWPNLFIGGTYPAEINYLKTWLYDRLEWIDFNLPRVASAPAPELPISALSLSPPYPNPLDYQARMTLSVGRNQNVRVEIYDALGRRVTVLFDGRVETNSPQPLTLSAAALAGGVYLVRAIGESSNETRRVAIIR